MTYWVHSRPDATVLCPMPHDEEREASPGLLLCHGCVRQLRRDIADLPGLHHELAYALAPSGSGAGGRISGSKDPNIALNLHAVRAREAIERVLTSWTQVVCDERGLDGPDDLTLGSIGGWLLQHVDWLAAQPYADEAADSFRDASRSAFDLAFPSGRRRIELGPCIEPGCDGMLVVTIARIDDMFPATIKCSAEQPHEWTSDRWVRDLMPKLVRREAS